MRYPKDKPKNTKKKGGDYMLTNPTHRTHDTNNQRLGLLVAGMAGIVAGAAGVTALALSDKDIRKKVGKRAHEAKESLQQWSTTKLHEYRSTHKKTDDGIDEITETLTTAEEKVKN